MVKIFVHWTMTYCKCCFVVTRPMNNFLTDSGESSEEKNTRIFGHFSLHGGGVSSIPKLLISLP